MPSSPLILLASPHHFRYSRWLTYLSTAYRPIDASALKKCNSHFPFFSQSSITVHVNSHFFTVIPQSLRELTPMESTGARAKVLSSEMATWSGHDFMVI